MFVFMVMLILPRYILPHHKFRMLSIADFLEGRTVLTGDPDWRNTSFIWDRFRYSVAHPT